MSSLLPIEKHSIKDAVEGIVSAGLGERFVLPGLTGSSKAYILAKSFLSTKKSFLVVLPDNEIAEEFAHDLEFFLKPVLSKVEGSRVEGKGDVLFYQIG